MSEQAEAAGSFLEEAAATPAPEGNDNPPPAPEPGTADESIEYVESAPPEWAPEKFWDKDKRQLRVEELGKGYKNLETLLGREKIPMPANDDDTEGWDRVHQAFRPPDENAYVLEKPEEMPEGMVYNDDLEKDYRSFAYENGLTKQQAKNIHDKYVKMELERYTQHLKDRAEDKANAEIAMRREMGDRKWEGFKAKTGAVYKRYADPDFAQFLTETGLGNDPRMIKMFGRIGMDMSGDTKLEGRSEPQMTPADVDKAISEFRGKNQEALMNDRHPDNKRATAELQRLYQMKFPEADAGSGW
jgi:hypothetical protein